MHRSYKPPFKHYVKKAHRPLRLAIEDEVERVCETPEIGEPKQGDLAGIRVHKFKFNRQEYLLAYRPPTEKAMNDVRQIEFLVIDFYQIGSHENFYDELKRYLREE